MRRLGDTMRRDPNADEKLILEHVVELAEAWKLGELSLGDVRAQCTGWQRFMAIRFARISSAQKLALMALVDALVEDQKNEPIRTMFVDGRLVADRAPINLAGGERDVAPLWMTPTELAERGYKLVTDHAGKRVWVSPMYWMDDEAIYPLYEQPPGERRREREAAMMAKYRAYMRKRGRVSSE